MPTLVIILIIITAILLILIGSLQSSKKEGTGNSLGSMGVHQIIGVQKTSDLLEQITWGLLIALFVLSLTTSFLLKKNHTNLRISPNLERLQHQDLLTEPNQEHTSDTKHTNSDSLPQQELD